MTPAVLNASKEPTWNTIIVFAIAVVSGLAVFWLNGTALFYYDTAGYLGQGQEVLRQLDIFQPPSEAGGSGIGGSDDDNQVIGSRAVVYSMFLATFSSFDKIWLIPAVQFGLLFGSVWLLAKTTESYIQLPISALKLASLLMIVACLGSASFYVAYLMPDIFAAILLLATAGMVAFFDKLELLQKLSLIGLAVLSVVVHPSHLIIAGIMLPIAIVSSLLVSRKQFWKIVLAVSLIPALGVLERYAFNFTVEQTTQNEVVYLPFLSARLISDGPGATFLDRNCPDPQWSTCILYEMLNDDVPLSPETILFSRDETSGSFALLSPPEQSRIASEQTTFFRTVMMEHPFRVALAALNNTIDQLGRYSVAMTIPDQHSYDQATKIFAGFPPEFANGRLVGSAERWVDQVNRIHTVYYLISAAALLALIALPQSRVPGPMRLFGGMIVIGLLANAFVTGAISQPADRYGARVIFLLPMTALLLVMSSAHLTSPKQSNER